MGSEVYLGIDVGAVRVGAAISDPTLTYALPLEVIPAKRAFDRLKYLVEEYRVTLVIVGMPLTLRGEHGPQAKVIDSFIENLRPVIAPCEIVTFDESFTSSEAEAKLAHVPAKKRREIADAVAASLILEGWLKRKA